MPERRRNLAYLLLGSIALLLYSQFLSISLDDFDAFSFALALGNWESAYRDVQAPGFPVYLAAGKLLLYLVGDARLALTLLSAISGAVGLVSVAWLADGLGKPRVGLLAAALLLFMPGYWLHSEYALSDMPGLVLMLTAMAFLLHGTQWRWHFVIGCALTGLSLGLRPHNALPLAITGLYVLWQLRHHDKDRLTTIITGFTAGLVGIVVWLIPIIMAFGSPGSYLEHIRAHSIHIQQSDSIVSQGLSAGMLQARAAAYLEGWSHLLAGGGNISLLVIGAVLLVGLLRVPRRQRLSWFCAVWFVSSATKIFLLASLERPRLFLPALVPLLLLVAYGYLQYHPRGRLRLLRAVPLLLLVLLLVRTTPLVARLNQEQSAPVQAIHYLRANYPLQTADVLVVSQGSFRAAQYYLHDQHQLYTPFFDAGAWSQDVAARQPDYIVVLDGDEIAPAVFDAITTPHDYISIDDRVFERDRRVFPQHVTVRLQVFIPRAQLQPQQLSLPDDGQIAAGEPTQGRYFGEGWYRIELLGPVPGRWANETAVMRVALPARDTRVTFLATPFMGGQSVDIVVNGQPVATLPINIVWGEYEFTIPAQVIAAAQISQIEFRHAQAIVPDGHYRQLAAGYSNFTFQQSD